MTGCPDNAACVTIEPLTLDDREQFILDNQWAFKHGAMMEFGQRDDHVDDDGEIISRSTIERCIDGPGGEAHRIIVDGEKVGGLILTINPETRRNHLDILFVLPEAHGRGIGYGAWRAVERLHPETRIWETCTPYFEKRNIHFYVNKCGFHIVEFHNGFHPDPESPSEDSAEGPDEMFRMIKVME